MWSGWYKGDGTYSLPAGIFSVQYVCYYFSQMVTMMWTIAGLHIAIGHTASSSSWYGSYCNRGPLRIWTPCFWNLMALTRLPISGTLLAANFLSLWACYLIQCSVINFLSPLFLFLICHSQSQWKNAWLHQQLPQKMALQPYCKTTPKCVHIFNQGQG